jgi:hypothetical protein
MLAYLLQNLLQNSNDFSKQIQNLRNSSHYNFITNPLYLGGTQIYQVRTKFTMKGKDVFENNCTTEWSS